MSMWNDKCNEAARKDNRHLEAARKGDRHVEVEMKNDMHIEVEEDGICVAGKEYHRLDEVGKEDRLDVVGRES